MPQPDQYDDRADGQQDTTAWADADEEAQLLMSEGFEFEDHVSPSSARVLTRRHWLERPRTALPHKITPFLSTAQEAPLLLLDRMLPKQNHKVALFVASIMSWAIVFALLLKAQLPVHDGEGQFVVNLDCVDGLWDRKNFCGLDGINCRPFSNSSFAFRCPANCAGVQLLNSRAIGPLDVNYRPLVIGDNPYRSDSWICGSAIHAGIITDTSGGCGRISLVGKTDNFPGTQKHGIESIPFDSYFPSSFNVSKDESLRCHNDPHNKILIWSLLFTAALSLFTTSPTHFITIFIIIFATVSFASDPPSASYRNITVLPDHISSLAKRLLPATFVAVILYQTTVKRTINGLKAQYEKTFFWLGGFWFGALSNYTFEWIPISRLTAHDLEQQPGAKLALAIILIFLVCIVLQQIYYFWVERRLLRYLALYGLFIFSIVVFLAIPGVLLRLHHYIIALLLLPGTSMQTRPSLLYQGILLGLFVNGVSRWDFDSVLQTADALRGDASLDSLLPSLTEPVIRPGNISFTWPTPPVGIDGISALVNDVERIRTFFLDDDAGILGGFTWTRPADFHLSEYFRFAFLRSGQTLDYTKADTWFRNGTWLVNAR